MPFPKYAAVKDKFCISYFGNANEYLVQLRLLRPQLERAFPELKIYLSCKDDAYYLLKGEGRIVLKSQLYEKDFGYIRNLVSNLRSHPVEDLFLESGLEIEPVQTKRHGENGGVTIYPQGIVPTKGMSLDQIAAAAKLAMNEGYKIVEPGYGFWAIGVENEQLFLAASKGYRTSLVPRGVGTNLYQKMFPNGEILSL